MKYKPTMFDVDRLKKQADEEWKLKVKAEKSGLALVAAYHRDRWLERRRWAEEVRVSLLPPQPPKPRTAVVAAGGRQTPRKAPARRTRAVPPQPAPSTTPAWEQEWRGACRLWSRAAALRSQGRHEQAAVADRMAAAHINSINASARKGQ